MTRAEGGARALGSDERARVPFALVGVVLLLSSAGLTATLGPRAAAPADPAVERAVERADAQTATALRRAVVRAARAAARQPVTVPADTPAGRTLDADRTFGDYLELRVALAARRALPRADARVGRVTVVPELEPTGNASVADGPGVATADRLEAVAADVRVERALSGRAVRVAVENLTLVVRRDGRVVERLRRSPTFVVRTPVFALHDRTVAFQRRLDAPLDEPGLTRGVTARLHAVAWARGYAQHGGAPIENVLANRHAALAANDGLLSAQRAALGRHDPDARAALADAGLRTAATDLLAGAGVPEGATAALFEAAEGTPGGGQPTSERGAGGERQSGAPAHDRWGEPTTLAAAPAAEATHREFVRWGGVERAVAGALADDPGAAPDAETIRHRVRADLTAFRDRIGAVTVTVPRRAAGTYAEGRSPPALLAARLAARRPALVGRRGSTPTGRAVAAARRDYLDRVIARLERRAEDRADRRDDVAERLLDAGVGPLDRLRAAMRASASTPQPAGPTAVDRVDGAPPVLSLDGDGRAPALVARNLNAFALPYEDAADVAVGAATDPPSGDRAESVPRRLAGAVVAEGLERVGDAARARALSGPLSRLPAGLPVAPIPAYWYATVNVWRVQVRGEYRRFAVRSRRGAAGEGLAYVRDGGVVRLDVDGDGTRERLGHAPRVAFSVDTAVGVVVPPGPNGVGDTDGDADERSAGWPEPGPSGSAAGRRARHGKG